ncbi:hypothetical protein [Curtobacterium flaccumfaciens]|uniref:hypothetical protein n=1 Tax=Curtobacterium flaccumfaciens TaxID=2035 RepID=UPI0039928648
MLLILSNPAELGGEAAPTSCSHAAISPAATQASIAISTIYDNAGYGGSSYTISTSANCNADAWGFQDINVIGWYGRVSSFKNYSGCKTAVFESTKYGGSHYGYTTNASNLGAMNDKAKSWRVSK